MGQAAAPIAMGAGSLLGGLFGGTNQGQKFVGAPGSDILRTGIINALFGPGSGYNRPGQDASTIGTGGGGLFGTLVGLAGGGAGPAQRQGTGIGQFTNQMSPEMRALNVAFPALQNMLTGNVPSGLDALTPLFKQNLDLASNKLTANAPGGRFSSGMLQAQGQLGSQATNDFNLLASQMIQQGLNRQLQAATTLGGLANQAGGAQLQALQMLLGPSLGSAFGGSILTQPSGLQQGMQAGGAMAQLLMLQQLLGNGSRGGGFTPMTSPQIPFTPPAFNPTL